MRISKLNHKFDKAAGKAREERRIKEGALNRAELRKRVAVADAVAVVERKLKERNQAADLAAIITHAIADGKDFELSGGWEMGTYNMRLRVGLLVSSYAISEMLLYRRDRQSFDCASYALLHLIHGYRQAEMNPWATP